MGFGDNIMATGMAKGAAGRGRRVAFGDKDQRKIIWDHNSEAIFRYNPNVAVPGEESLSNLEWIKYHRGHRLYNVQISSSKWRWRRSFRPTPGEIYFDDDELIFAESVGKGFVLIEPNVPNWKQVAPNKQWPVERFAEVARELKRQGHEVVQLNYGEKFSLVEARQVRTRDFRQAMAVLHRAKLAVLPEGGLHHAAAASALMRNGVVVSSYVPAVVLFGGFIHPRTTGYDLHVNLAVGDEACGQFVPCTHCREAMDAISVDDVVKATGRWLGRSAVHAGVGSG